MSETTDCYGCELPMESPFVVHSGVEPTPYCVRCELVRRVWGIDVRDHEPGTLSNGTYTMRRRAES